MTEKQTKLQASCLTALNVLGPTTARSIAAFLSFHLKRNVYTSPVTNALESLVRRRLVDTVPCVAGKGTVTLYWVPVS